MTKPDKLTIEAIKKWMETPSPLPDFSECAMVGTQLIDTMRENEILREGLQDIANGTSRYMTIARMALDKISSCKHSVMKDSVTCPPADTSAEVATREDARPESFTKLQSPKSMSGM